MSILTESSDYFMDYFITPAASCDAKALANLETQVFVAADGLLTKRAFAYHIHKQNLLLVAKQQGAAELLGYILVFVHTRSARIYSLAVNPAFQQQGIARALISSALQAVTARQIFDVYLELRTTNTKALKLYESFGFKLDRIKPAYYGDQADAMRMQCHLEQEKHQN